MPPGLLFFPLFIFSPFFSLVWIPTDYARCYRRHESIEQLFGELLLRRHVSLRRIKQIRVLLQRVLILFFCHLDYRVRSQTNNIYFIASDHLIITVWLVSLSTITYKHLDIYLSTLVSGSLTPNYRNDLRETYYSLYYFNISFVVCAYILVYYYNNM